MAAAVTAYAAHTTSGVLLVLIPLAGAAALAALTHEKTRLPAVLLIGAFGVYTGVALAPMVWRALPLTSLPFAARARRRGRLARRRRGDLRALRPQRTFNV